MNIGDFFNKLFAGFTGRTTGNMKSSNGGWTTYNPASLPKMTSNYLPSQSQPYAYHPKTLRQGITPANIAYNEQILAPYFAKYSVKYHIPYGVLRGMCMTESNMGTDPNAHVKRTRGGRGIMQIELASHPTTGSSAYDPEQAIAYAAKYLRSLYDRFGSWQKAIVAYNKGQGTVARLISQYGNNWYAHRNDSRGGDNAYYSKVSNAAGYAYA